MQPGERVGRFEIEGEGARGGTATVFRARDHRDHRDVALKVLRPGAMQQLARFEREAAILAGLRHPNIVEYIGHDATPDGVHYLVMEWVEGETLEDRLESDGLSRRAVIAMAIQLCRALDAIHASGVVHRDVKPSNIMLVGGDPGRVKLVDLGIARRTEEPARLTRSGMVVGTAGYLAPELVRGRTAVIDGRADLFSLGCVLHECFTGTPTFRGDTSLAVYAKVLLHDPPPLRGFDAAIPPALDALVGSLLARRPEQRPAGAAEVERALMRLGALPDAATRAAPRDMLRTMSGNDAPLCGILIGRAGDDVPMLAMLDAAAIALETFDRSVAVVIAGDAAVATRHALAIARAMPDAVVVVAPGASADDCIDRCARLLAELELASELSDHGGRGVGPGVGPGVWPGVWIDDRAGERLVASFHIERAGRFLRVAGELT